MFVFFQAEDGIRDLVRSRGLGDVYKRQRLLRELRVEGKRAGEGVTSMVIDLEDAVTDHHQHAALDSAIATLNELTQPS